MTGRISFCAAPPTGVDSVQTQSVPVRNCSGTNFKGKGYDYYDKPQKKTSPVLTMGCVLGAAAALIVSLGYAHKTDALSKIKNGKFKDILKKAEPVTKKCHEWCSIVKTKCSELVDKLKKTGKN